MSNMVAINTLSHHGRFCPEGQALVGQICLIKMGGEVIMRVNIKIW